MRSRDVRPVNGSDICGVRSADDVASSRVSENARARARVHARTHVRLSLARLAARVQRAPLILALARESFLRFFPLRLRDTLRRARTTRSRAGGAGGAEDTRRSRDPTERKRERGEGRRREPLNVAKTPRRRQNVRRARHEPPRTTQPIPATRRLAPHASLVFRIAWSTA